MNNDLFLRITHAAIALLFIAPTVLLANIGIIPLGTNATMQSSSPPVASNFLGNPAWGDTSTQFAERDFSIGIHNTLSVQFRGILSALDAEDELSTLLDNDDEDLDLSVVGDSVDLVNDELLLNDQFRGAGTFSSGMVIGFPLLGGTVSFAYNVSGYANARFLARQGIVVNQTALEDLIQETITGDDNEVNSDDVADTLASDGAIYTKFARIDEFAINYSWTIPEADSLLGASVSFGTRVKLMGISLRKDVTAFRSFISNATSATEIIEDNLLEFRDDSVRQSAFDVDATAIDFGLIAQWDYVSLGFTAFNINAPEVQYPEIGTGDNTNDLLAQSFTDQISLAESYVVAPRYRIEGALYSSDRYFVLSASYDLIEYLDPLADSFQWANAGFTFTPSPKIGYYTTNWLPAIRLGYNKNMVGLKQDTYNVGLTWGFMTLDFIATPNLTSVSNVKNSDDTGQLGAQIGLDLTF